MKVKFKKILAVALAICLVFLVSCAKKAASSQSTSNAAFNDSEVEETVNTSLHDKTISTETETALNTSNTQTTQKKDNSEKRKSTTESAKSTKTQKSTKPSTKATTLTATASTTVDPNKKFCYLSIECKTVLTEENFKKLDLSKQNVVPSDGVILKKTKIPFNSGETVYDVFKRACQNNVCAHKCQYCQGRIQFESLPSAYGAYIKGIHFLYEKDCGTKSGWMYKVNGIFPDKAVDYYTVNSNDEIIFVYTCDYNDV